MGPGISVKSALSTATGPRLSYLAAISADIEIVSREAGSATRSVSLGLVSIPMVYKGEEVEEEVEVVSANRRSLGKMAGL